MTYASEVLADSPTVWWDTREASGVTQPDRSGNGHVGTIHGSPTLDATNGLTFSGGSGQWVESSAFYGPLDAATPFTFEAVVNLSSVSGTPAFAFFLDDPDTFDNFASVEAVGVGYLGMEWNEPQTGFNLFDVDSPYTTGALHHLASVFDGATARLYVDGVQIKSAATASAGFKPTGACKFGIAGFTDGSVSIVGSQKHGAYYPVALSAARIAAHAAASDDDPNPAAGTYRFTPPTENTVSNVAYDAPGPLSNKLMRYYPSRKRGRTVWKIDETTFSFDQPFPMVEDSGPNRDSLFPYPPVPASGIGTTISNLIAITYQKVFYGGHVYYLDDDVEVAVLGTFLSDAGYTVSDWLVAV